jgi:hypothetical protein
MVVDGAQDDDDDEDIIDQVKDQLENEGVFEQNVEGLEVRLILIPI